MTVMDEPIPSQAEDQKLAEDEENDALSLDAEVLERQRLFGEKLRTLYNEVVQEPTPDSFLTLLNELAAKEGGE
jgi:formate dehydrogenase maturation protein FdhE